LLKALSDYSHLKVLGLCQTKMDKDSMLLLGDIVNGNYHLRELDIAWNQVTAMNMWELVQNIEFCRNLSYLNLSFNSFVGKHCADIVGSLCSFIRRNKKLMHLDISYCGLKNDNILEISKAVRKSRSLLAIHLSGNLISDEVKKKIRDHLQPRKRVKDLYYQINDPDSEDEVTTTQQSKLNLSTAIQQKLVKYAQQEAMGENNGEQNPNLQGNPGERLIFSRVLGHFELPKAHKWIESSDCWVCSRHMYTVMVVSKSIAHSFFVRPKRKDRENFLSKITHARGKYEEHNDEEYGSDQDEIFYDAEDEREKHNAILNNQVTGQFSRWKCRSMMPLGEYMRRLRKNQQD